MCVNMWLWEFPLEVIMKDIVLEYDAKIDSKRRITLRNTSYQYFHVQMNKDGSILLNPRVLINPIEIDKKTLDMMEKSMENFSKGAVSKPINLKK